MELRKTLKTIALSALTTLATLPALAAELVMVEQPGCAYCRQWDREIADIYPKTPEGEAAPLRRAQLKDIKDSGIDLVRPVMFTPTFLLVDAGSEVARLEGYAGEEMFWWGLGALMKDHLPEALPPLPAGAADEN